ncbi:hypothetical protein B7R54_08670 [Subtercola boreus]|uniref:Uncharacterized protein n=1 Tax=Subtercola boreus TaxID=120213 RepID=A0A3E0VH77_9MICO|nr:hypothetical protein [Subtercola boreus]RFA09294.1 hypothetical protein B7R54_08670 [Subtercola boreus]TQL53678.1 hypothetical protein FB464_1194 [Subtercola boreus]
MTAVIKHELRASAGAFGSYHPEGWHPKLSVTLLGPSAAACQVVWAVTRPDGAPWFEHRVPAPVLDDRQIATVDLELWHDALDLDEAGAVPFTLRLVSEPDVVPGVDELLHDGRMLVMKLPGEHCYAVATEWMLPRSLLGLDTVDEPDAPRLTGRVFVAGEPDVWRLEAHCFRDGVRLAGASSVESVHTFTANDGRVLGQEVGFAFDSIRGWNNLSESGWGGDWQLLDQNDGRYRVALVDGPSPVGEVSFEVVRGRIMAPVAVEPDAACGAVIVVERAGGVGGAPGGDPYGDPVTAAATTTLDEVYALRHELQASDGEATLDDKARLDDKTAAALQAFVDRAERLLVTWESELAAPPPYDFGQVLAAEAVGRERAGCEELAAAVSGVPGVHAVLLSGEPIGLAELRARTAALFPAAETRVAASQQAEVDALAPYRDLLSGDKLAVFDDHPADSFVYTTTDRRIIETPEELAAAEFWFFEGPLDIPGSARVEGVEITGSVQGWRVLGWQFDGSGAVLAEFESQGLGSSAPKTAFRPPV